MLNEYDFSKGVRGKYTKRSAEGTNVVVLAPDVGAAFPDADSVNKALRALIEIARKSTKQGDSLRSGGCLIPEASRAMDKLERYRDIVSRITEDYGHGKACHGQIDYIAIVDRAKDHYAAMRVGWDGDCRVHGCVIHLDIIGGKVWIQYDGTNRPVADELLAAGIPREDIVLAFHPANLRQYTDFAVG